MSTLVGNIVIKVQKQHKDIPAEEIARTLALISGCVVLFIGLARIGWIVEWISLTAITAFMTGSAISIGVGQIPALLGISGVNTREPAYIVFINTLKALPNAKMDAAMGLTALFMLYAIRVGFNFLSAKQPNRKKTYFFLSTLRIAFVLLLYILISYLVNRKIKDPKKAHFKILGNIPRGMFEPSRSGRSKLTQFRFHTRRSSQGKHKDDQSFCQRATCYHHRLAHRTHRHFQVFWKNQQLCHQSISRTCRNWLHKCFRAFPRCLPRYRFFLENSHQVESRCPHTICWNVHSRCCSFGALCFDISFLFHPAEQSCCCNHPRSRRLDYPAFCGISILGGLAP